MNTHNEKIRHLRTDYNRGVLDTENAPGNPLELFSAWMHDAVDSGMEDPNAMNLATVSRDGRLSSRIVLLREFNENGYVFYTNYKSHKGDQLNENARAALNFFWPQLHRQIRIEGKSEYVSPSESDSYFDSRPRESQIGAWASDQSKVLSNRQELEEKIENLTKKFEGSHVPRPAHWGGFRIMPDYYEFWQGRTSRLHDRLSYTLEGISWKKTLLYP